MQHVLRIEHRTDRYNNNGHFKGPFSGAPENRGPLDFCNMPMPYSDGIDLQPEQTDWVFGMLPDQVNWYLSENDRKELAEFGYVMRRYAVRPGFVEVGQSQVAFDPSNAKVVEVLELVEQRVAQCSNGQLVAR